MEGSVLKYERWLCLQGGRKDRWKQSIQINETKEQFMQRDDRRVAGSTDLLHAVGKCVSLHQDRIRDVCGRGGGMSHRRFCLQDAGFRSRACFPFCSGAQRAKRY